MIINLLRLNPGKPYKVVYDSSLNPELFKNTRPLLGLKSIHINVTLIMVDHLLSINFTGFVEAILECSYTLETFVKRLNINDSFELSDDDNDEEMEHLPNKNNDLNLDSYLLSAITSEIPMVVVKPGAKLPQGDKSCRVISEDEYNKEKKDTCDPRFDKLKDIDID